MLIAMVAENLNVGRVIRAARAARNNMIILKVERATASATAIIVFDEYGLPEVELGFRGLWHVGVSSVGERSIGACLRCRQA